MPGNARQGSVVRRSNLPPVVRRLLQAKVRRLRNDEISIS